MATPPLDKGPLGSSLAHVPCHRPLYPSVARFHVLDARERLSIPYFQPISDLCSLTLIHNLTTNRLLPIKQISSRPTETPTSCGLKLIGSVRRSPGKFSYLDVCAMSLFHRDNFACMTCHAPAARPCGSSSMQHYTSLTRRTIFHSSLLPCRITNILQRCVYPWPSLIKMRPYRQSTA